VGKSAKTLHSEAYRKFRERLRQAREEAGFTQMEAARRLGRPQSFVSKCEAGERRVDVVELAWFADLYAKRLGFFIPKK
jgi:transcriptional regulator with XRE-family HTH domain